MTKIKKQSKEVTEYCKSKLKSNGGPGCGLCKLHKVCAVSYPLSIENINNHIDSMKIAFKNTLK